MLIEKIYFDLDGVFADFDRGLDELCDFKPIPINDYHEPSYKLEKWNRINKVQDFFLKLKLMPRAKEFFDIIYSRYKDRVEILTGLPKPVHNVRFAKENKILWVKKMLSEHVVVNTVYSEEKVKYCQGSGYILVDDLEKTIKSWNAAGGVGILHKNIDETMIYFKNLGII